MELQEYKIMFDVEEKHWWYKGLRDLIFSTIAKEFDPGRSIRILDAGCGTGFSLKCLKDYGEAFGIDISDMAISFCRKRGLDKIAQASVAELPFREGSFDLVISTDVLYHKLVDDEKALREICRVIKKDGLFIVHVPAHDSLRRAHDERVHTRHRYTTTELSAKLRAKGFAVKKISYRNSFLLPAVAMMALYGEDLKGSPDLKKNNGAANTLLYPLLKAENALLKKFNMPFGTSIFCVARKETRL